MGSVVCGRASLRWEGGNAATAGVKRRRLTRERARQLVTDLEQVTIRELAIDVKHAVDLGLELGIYAYDAYILEAARSSGFPLLALDGPIPRRSGNWLVPTKKSTTNPDMPPSMLDAQYGPPSGPRKSDDNPTYSTGPKTGSMQGVFG